MPPIQVEVHDCVLKRGEKAEDQNGKGFSQALQSFSDSHLSHGSVAEGDDKAARGQKQLAVHAQRELGADVVDSGLWRNGRVGELGVLQWDRQRQKQTETERHRVEKLTSIFDTIVRFTEPKSTLQVPAAGA